MNWQYICEVVIPIICVTIILIYCLYVMRAGAVNTITDILKLIFGNDKNVIALLIATIVIYCIYIMGAQATTIASNGMSGLLGMAMGAKMEAPKA